MRYSFRADENRDGRPPPPSDELSAAVDAAVEHLFSELGIVGAIAVVYDQSAGPSDRDYVFGGGLGGNPSDVGNALLISVRHLIASVTQSQGLSEAVEFQAEFARLVTMLPRGPIEPE